MSTPRRPVKPQVPRRSSRARTGVQAPPRAQAAAETHVDDSRVSPQRPTTPPKREPREATPDTQAESRPGFRSASRQEPTSAARPAAQREDKPALGSGAGTYIDARDRFLQAVKPRPWKIQRRPLIIAIAIAALLAAAVCAVLMWVPALRASNVEVTGATYTDKAALARAADSELGEPLAFISTSDIEKQASAVPGVRKVSVEREWPSTIKMTVSERAPIARVTAGGKTEVVDVHAVALPEASVRGKTLPALTVHPSAAKVPETRAALVEVIAALPPSMKLALVSATASTPSNITLQVKTNGGVKTIVWGGAEDSELKAKVVKALVGQPGTVIDVSAPNAPTVR